MTDTPPLSMETYIANLEREIATLRADLAETHAEAERLTDETIALKHQIAVKDKRIVELEDTLAQTQQGLQETGWQLAGVEICLEAVRKSLENEAPVYDDCDRWLYGGDGLP